jgi:hypothetical protein
MKDKILQRKDMVIYLGISPYTLDTWLKRGKIPFSFYTGIGNYTCWTIKLAKEIKSQLNLSKQRFKLNTQHTYKEHYFGKEIR